MKYDDDTIAAKSGYQRTQPPRGTNAIKFLKLLRPQGPWVITAIVPDGTTCTRTFTEAEAARKFIVQHNENKENVYYTGAPCGGSPRKKPSKVDIEAVEFLHVDADPKDDETPDQFKARIMPLIEGFEPKPTFVVDSGNGIQLLWCLKHPVEVTSPEVISDIEARNYALHEALGADPVTRNIDRILRVPGTTNYPNAAKRRLGRTECRAKLLAYNDVVHPLSTFPAKQQEEAPESEQSTSSSELPQKLLTMLCVPGSGGYPTRSHLTFAFLTGAVRANVRDDVIIAACLDATYAAGGIYQEVADKGGRRYLVRQLAKAKLAQPQQSKKQYELVRAVDVIIRPLDWLWEGHLLRGALELTTGKPGMGKSQIQCSLVACITTGRNWPDGQVGPKRGNVIMVTTEDGLEQVVMPRLLAAGADRKRIFFLTAIKHDNKRRMFLLGEDLDELKRLIEDTGDVVMVGIDPITAYMGKINSSSVTDVRGQLGPLADLASHTNVAFAAVTHPSKDAGQNAMNHFIGSQAFIAAARIGHLCQPEMKEDEYGGLVKTGRNLFTWAPGGNHKKMSTIAYRIEEEEFVIPPAPAGDHAARIRANAQLVEDVPYIAWEGVVDLSADEAVAATSPKAQPRTAAADAFLRGLLARGPVVAKDVYAQAEAGGFSPRQMRDAKERIGAHATKQKGVPDGGVGVEPYDPPRVGTSNGNLRFLPIYQ